MSWVSAQAEKLAARYGTPLYVYDAERVRTAFREFRDAFPYNPVECHYAIVCNKNHYLVRALYEAGVGVHANTPGDAHAALAAGVPARRIIYSGTNLSGADFGYLLERGIRMNLDSLDQLRDLAAHPARVCCGGVEAGLRVLIDPEERANRIGVAPNELGEAVAIARATGIRLTGLHMYAGTNTRRLERFLECFDRMTNASGALPDLEYLDAGGGYGVAYRDGDPPLPLAELGRALAARMEELSARRGRRICLLLEPGRILVAAAGVLLTRVVSVKQRGGRRYAGVDATVGNIVVESVYHPYHRIEAAAPRGPLLDIPTDVCGNTTHSRDFLGCSCRLPDLRPGDLLVLRDVGAYGYAMSSHFLNRPRPAEVVLDRGEQRLTTRRETLEDLMGTQLLGGAE